MKARLTFLSGPHLGRHLIVRHQTINIGGDRSHTVYLPQVAAGTLLAVIEPGGSTYTIAARHALASLMVNHTALDQATLRDGDHVQIAGRHSFRFDAVPEGRDTRKSMRRIVRESWKAAAQAETGRTGRCGFFLRHVCHCMAHDATRSAKVGTVATVTAVVFAVLLGGLSLMRARAADRRVIALSTQVAEGTGQRQRLEREVARLRQLEQEKVQTQARLGEVSRDLEGAEQRLARLERQTPDLLASIETARQSVAFLLVGYALYEKASGKPLRFASVDATGRPQAADNGAYETSVDGVGPIVTSYVTGSGFLIAGDRLLTNRHVVEPWRGDTSVEAAIKRGFRPRHTLVRAYFPGLTRPVDLWLVKVASGADVAVLRAHSPTDRMPLTLAPPERLVSPGDLIVVIGYPTGFDALLAKADEAVAHRIIERTGDSWPALARALASQKLITPLVTVGHVGDVGPNIVYDAATTHGSSGGPVLSVTGEVIALNYAALEQFAGARFGIPIRLVHQLLEPRAGGDAR